MRRTRRIVGYVLTTLVAVIIGGFTTAHIAARLRETKNAADIAPASGYFLMTPRGKLFVQEIGPPDGVPVVLVHGTAVWSEVWRPTMEALAKAGFRSIAFDVPPFGFSDRPATPAYSREDQAQRIIDLLDGMSLQRAIVVAHSIGARGPMEAAIRYPERLKGLVLVCGALGLRDKAPLPMPVRVILDHRALLDTLLEATVTNPLMTKTLFARLLARKETATDDLVAVMQKPMPVRGSTDDFGQWLATVLSPDPLAQSLDPARYQEVRLPVSLIWGDEDEVTPLAQARDIASLVQGSTVDVIPGVGHVPQVEDFAAFRDALLRSVERMK